MRLITWRPLKKSAAAHPDAAAPLLAWRRVATRAQWASFAHVRADYNSADQVGRFTVFNIGGNKYRLVTTIHFNTRRVFIRAILTHKEYDRGHWKND